MTITHTITWEHGDDFLDDFVSAIESEMGLYTECRSWVHLILEYFSGDITFVNNDADGELCEVDCRYVNWQACEEILRKHLKAAAEEIQQISLPKKETDNE
jgi:hypothetical protein